MRNCKCAPMEIDALWDLQTSTKVPCLCSSQRFHLEVGADQHSSNMQFVAWNVERSCRSGSVLSCFCYPPLPLFMLRSKQYGSESGLFPRFLQSKLEHAG